MKLSIIVPVYNVEKYIARCIDGLLDQTMIEYEIIVVNDGTRDKSMDYVIEQSKKHNNIVIINRVNGGLSAARNTGIEHARGKYLLFCDSDDTIERECLKRLYDEAEQNRLDMLLFDANTICMERDLGEERYSYYREGIDESVMCGEQMLKELLKEKCYFASACLYLIKRSFLLEHKMSFYEGIIHEDELFTPIALMCARRVKHRNWPVYQRYIREGSIMTGTNEKIHLYGLYVVIKELCLFCDLKGLDKHGDEPIKRILTELVKDFLGRLEWLGKENYDLWSKRKNVIEMIQREHLNVGKKFYLYIMSVRLRKVFGKQQ